MADVTYRGTPATLRTALGRLGEVLTGKAPDPLGLAKGLATRVGVALLSQVQQAFIEKSRGGTGSDGITWPPLSPKTIAGRRVTAAERRAAGVGGKRTRGLLTPEQDALWRRIYGTRWASLVARGADPDEAREVAARIAWAVLKRAGARTRLSVFGSRQVDMLRDTGRLFKSLSPGHEETPSGEPEQVFEAVPGEVIVGTNVAYAGRQHARRPFWPPDGTLPPAWEGPVAEAAARGVEVAVQRLAESGGAP